MKVREFVIGHCVHRTVYANAKFCHSFANPCRLSCKIQIVIFILITICIPVTPDYKKIQCI